MTVRELIEQLSEHPPDTEVYVEQDSHDYWRTRLAYHADSLALLETQESQYHNCDRIVFRSDEDDFDDDEAVNRRLVIRTSKV